MAWFSRCYDFFIFLFSRFFFRFDCLIFAQLYKIFSSDLPLEDVKLKRQNKNLDVKPIVKNKNLDVKAIETFSWVDFPLPLTTTRSSHEVRKRFVTVVALSSSSPSFFECSCQLREIFQPHLSSLSSGIKKSWGLFCSRAVAVISCFVFCYDAAGVVFDLSLNLKGHFRSRFSLHVPENIEKSVEIIESKNPIFLHWFVI